MEFTLPHRGEGSEAYSQSELVELGRGVRHARSGLFAPPPTFARPFGQAPVPPPSEGEVMLTAVAELTTIPTSPHHSCRVYLAITLIPHDRVCRHLSNMMPDASSVVALRE